jgi:hypothetical protein
MTQRDIVVIADPVRSSGYCVLAAGAFKGAAMAGPLGEIFAGSSEQTRQQLRQLQEAAVRSERWLPDILRVCCLLGAEEGHGVVVEWFAIRTAVEIDDDGRPFVEIDGKRLPVMRDGGLHETPEERSAWIEEVRRRNQQAARTRLHAGSGIVRVPSSLTGMVKGSLPSSMSMDRRRTLVRNAAEMAAEDVVDQLSGKVERRRTRVSVEWSDLTRQRFMEHAEQAGRKRKRPPEPTATLWLERQAEVDSEDLWSGALDLLQNISTDAVVSLFACCVEACERGGWFAATPATIARHRGIDPVRMSTKQRQAFRDHLRLWTECEIRVSPIDAKPSSRDGSGGIYQRLPLLQLDRTIGMRGVGEVEVYRLHGDLWDSMQAGRAWLFDRAALSLDMRKHDLHWRIYSRLTGRWSLSWGRHAALREAGGLVRVRLVDLLDGPGFDWRSVRDERGAEHLLRRVEQALQDLVAWPGRPLLAEARLLRGAGEVETMEVEARPTPMLIEAFRVPRQVKEPSQQTRRKTRREGAKPDPRAVQA